VIELVIELKWKPKLPDLLIEYVSEWVLNHAKDTIDSKVKINTPIYLTGFIVVFDVETKINEKNLEIHS
jgi:hypothetical protein